MTSSPDQAVAAANLDTTRAVEYKKGMFMYPFEGASGLTGICSMDNANHQH